MHFAYNSYKPIIFDSNMLVSLQRLRIQRVINGGSQQGMVAKTAKVKATK
jgi:hypothetical protein